MKKFGATGIFGAFVIAVAAYAYIFEYKMRKADEQKKDNSLIIFDVAKDQISAIEIVRGSESFSLKKTGETWRLTKPVEDDVDVSSLDSFFETLNKEKSEMEISDTSMDYSIYGLDKPTGSIEIETKDSKKTKFFVGSEALQGKYYLRRNADVPVLLGTNEWKGFIQKTHKDFRSKELFRQPTKVVQEILIEQPNKPSTRFLLKDGKWTIPAARFLLDDRLLESFAKQILNLKALDVEAEDKANLAKYGLAKPVVTLKLSFENEKDPLIIKLSAENKDKNAFVITSALKPVFKVYSTLAEAFRKSALDFRDRESPFKFDTAKVFGLKVIGGLTPIDLVKADNKWDFAETKVEAKDVDQAQIVELINQISRMRAREFLTRKPSFKPKKTIILSGVDKKMIFELRIGEVLKGQNQVEVSTSLCEESLTLDEDLVRMLPQETLLRAKPVTNKDAPKPKDEDAKP